MLKGKGRHSYLIVGIGIVLALILILGSEAEKESAAAEAIDPISQATATEERKVKYLLEEMEGVADVSVMLKYDDAGSVSGVAVICADGENGLVQEKIIRLLRALFGIGSHQISVSG